MSNLLDTARQSLRHNGGLALLVGSVLVIIGLLLPWGGGTTYRNAFAHLPALAVLWATVGLWALVLALTRARLGDPQGLGALAVLASIGLVANLVIVLNGFSLTVGGALGGGSSLALIGLVATLLGIWQIEQGSSDTSALPLEGGAPSSETERSG